MTKEIFRRGNTLVEENGSGEIFVTILSNTNTKYPVQCRITPEHDHIKVTAHRNIITPTCVNGLSAFRIWGNI
jgi:hypothetical protein